MSTVVYTVITGGKDELSHPRKANPEFSYVCFTDDPDITSPLWQIVHVESDPQDPNRSAKQYKILPHRYFPKHEYSIWIDGSLEPKRDLSKLLKYLSTGFDIAFFPHNQRSCIYEESEVCIERDMDDPEAIRGQMAEYERDGYPRNNGLVRGGVIIRRHNVAHVVQAMEAWWDEICRHSRRDQLSFNYVAWKLGLRYRTITKNYDKYFRYHRHKSPTSGQWRGRK